MALMLSKLQKTCEMFESILEDIALPTAAASSKLENNVYGRICSSVNKDISPQFLSDTANGRKTVFVFGYDGVSMILHQPSTFDALLKLGFTKDYIHYEAPTGRSITELFAGKDVFVNELNCGTWLVIFLPTLYKEPFTIYPATWKGVAKAIKALYPLVYEDFEKHFDELKLKPIEMFEREAGFKFIESRKALDSKDTEAPPYFSYEYLCSLPEPHTSWQVRAFLYCELRLLEMFKGTGVTFTSDMEHGVKEYLCPNISVSNFCSNGAEVIPLDVIVPSH